MSHTRTVYCSHCGGRGHNKAGCSDHRDFIERQRTTNPNDYRVRQYDAKKANRAAAAQNRRCSYCGEHGHNRASCPKLKAAMESYRCKNVQYRKNVLAALIESGLGPGAMITIERYAGEITLKVITEVNWAEINMSDKGTGPLVSAPIDKITDPYWRQSIRISRFVTGQSYGADYVITVPSTESQIRASVPASFLDGTLGLKAIFKEKGSNLRTMKTSWGDYDREFDPDHYTTELS